VIRENLRTYGFMDLGISPSASKSANPQTPQIRTS
jgi:hypothetical protein